MNDNLINDFLNKKNIFAVIGVSRDITKYGRKVFEYLKKSGYTVYSINPNIDSVNESKCYSSLKVIPKTPDVVVFVVPPKITEENLIDCKNLGIKKVWMQPGSESNEAIRYCDENNFLVLHNVCIMMEILK